MFTTAIHVLPFRTAANFHTHTGRALVNYYFLHWLNFYNGHLYFIKLYFQISEINQYYQQNINDVNDLNQVLIFTNTEGWVG